MIRYALNCSEGHNFEAWFASSGAFESQQNRQVIGCPVCGSTHVSKTLMAPAVATARKSESLRVAANVPEHEATAMLRKLRKHLTENADYVGNKFAEEARRIHYNEVEKRGIYGEATSDEVRALVDEEIEFHALPTLPEEHN